MIYEDNEKYILAIPILFFMKKCVYRFDSKILSEFVLDYGNVVSNLDTPSYIYVEKFLTKSIERYSNTLKNNNDIVYVYPLLSNNNPFLLEKILNIGKKHNSWGGFFLTSPEELEMVLGIIEKSKTRDIYVVFQDPSFKDSDEHIIMSSYSILQKYNVLLLLVVNSMNQLNKYEQLLNKIYSKYGSLENISILIRVNLQYEDKNYHGLYSRFGVENIDEIIRLLNNKPIFKYIKLGLHSYPGTNILNIDLYDNYLSQYQKIYKYFVDKGVNISFVDVGGGFGINYEKGFVHSKLIFHALKKISEYFGDSIKILEPGRSIIGECGLFIAKVVDKKIKELNDKKYIILTLDGGFPHFARSYIYHQFHRIMILPNSENDKKIRKKEKYYLLIGGNSAAASDILYGKYNQQKDIVEAIYVEGFIPDIGDMIIFENAGAYGYIMKSNFSGRTNPHEYYLDSKGNLIKIRESKGIKDLFYGVINMGR